MSCFSEIVLFQRVYMWNKVLKQNKSRRCWSVNQKTSLREPWSFSQHYVMLWQRGGQRCAWEVGGGCEITMVAAVVTVIASCKIIAAKSAAWFGWGRYFRGISGRKFCLHTSVDIQLTADTCQCCLSCIGIAVDQQITVPKCRCALPQIN